MGRDDRLSRIGETIEGWAQRRDQNRTSAYERRAVRKILTSLGLTKVDLGIARPDNPDEEDWFLTMSWFSFRYPTCPVTLFARNAWSKFVIWDAFRVRNKRNGLWSNWGELVGSSPADKPVACVFPFPSEAGLGDGVIHNADLPYTSSEEARDLTRIQRIEDDGSSTSIELLSSFIHRLGLVWDPR